MMEWQRKQFFFPDIIDWEKILKNKKLGDKFSVTLLDEKGQKRDFNDLKIVLMQKINGALFLNGAINNDPSGYYYRLEFYIDNNQPNDNRAYLYPTGWPIGEKPAK